MIICAAIRIKGTNTVIGCIRHSNGYSTLRDLAPNTGLSEVEEGFLTDKGVFLDRTEAFIRAINCGQLSATTRHYKGEKNETDLYSEDLY